MAAIDAGIAEAARNGHAVGRQGGCGDRRPGRKHDPQAKEWFEQAARRWALKFSKPDDQAGTRSLWGRLYSTHAELIERRLTQIARAVCAGDPAASGNAAPRRWRGLRRQATVAPASAEPAMPPTPPVPVWPPAWSSHVVAEQATVDAAARTAQTRSPRTQPPMTVRRPHRRGPGRPTAPAVMTTGGVVPTPLLAALIRNGAALIPYAPRARKPRTATGPRWHCNASSAAATRDLSVPPAAAPAENCDVDHAIAYPAGPTHRRTCAACAEKATCSRRSTPATAAGRTKQYPDGRIEWTAPDRAHHHHHPARVFFPDWDISTAELPPPPQHPGPAPPRPP